jgi:hypothetical protein
VQSRKVKLEMMSATDIHKKNFSLQWTQLHKLGTSEKFPLSLTK